MDKDELLELCNDTVRSIQSILDELEGKKEVFSDINGTKYEEAVTLLNSLGIDMNQLVADEGWSIVSDMWGY